MNLYPSFKYQLSIQKVSVIVYYAVYAGMILLFGGVNLISVSIASNGSNMNMGVATTNGLSAVTAIMVFVLGCTSFKENFAMALQNGTSRRSLFLGRLCSTGALCLVLAVCDQAVTMLMGLLGKLPFIRMEARSLLETAFGPLGGWVTTALCSVAFTFFLLLAVSALGYFFTVLFYRLPTSGKVAVGVGMGAVFTFAVPVLKMIRDRFHLEALWEALCRGMTKFLSLAFGGPANWMVSCFVIFCVFSAFAWLLMRRAQVR